MFRVLDFCFCKNIFSLFEKLTFAMEANNFESQKQTLGFQHSIDWTCIFLVRWISNLCTNHFDFLKFFWVPIGRSNTSFRVFAFPNIYISFFFKRLNFQTYSWIFLKVLDSFSKTFVSQIWIIASYFKRGIVMVRNQQLKNNFCFGGSDLVNNSTYQSCFLKVCVSRLLL